MPKLGKKEYPYTEAGYKAYKKAKSVKELASLLNLSLPCVHNYIQRYKVKLYSQTRISKLSLRIAETFIYDVTLLDLAKKFNITKTTIRYHLEKFILYPDKYQLTSDWPPPKKIFHIKIINMLIKNPTDDPWTLRCYNLMDSTAKTDKLINDYWKYATGKVLNDYKGLHKEN